MSSHVHLCALSGEEPSERLIRPVHAGFARWLNARQDRLGPVFADRHRTIACEDEVVGPILAYIHNNPVRAGVVVDAADSTWTSQRAYLGLASAPAWLDVATGLMLSGFEPTEAGRAAFGAFLAARSDAPRDATLSGHAPRAVRRSARAHARAPLEVTSPRIEAGRLLYELRARQHTPLRAWRPGGYLPRRASARWSQRGGLPCWHGAFWGSRGPRWPRPWGLSDGAAAHLLRRQPERLAQAQPLARRVADACRGTGAPKVKK